METRTRHSTDSADCPEWAVLKLAKEFNEVSTLQGANRVRQNDECTSSLKSMVTLTKTRSLKVLVQCTKFEQKIKAMIASKVPDGQQSRPKLGRRPRQPTPATHTMNVAQLSLST